MLLRSDSETEKLLQQIKHAMDAGFYRYDPPKKPDYGFWTNITNDVASIPSEFIKGTAEGQVDVITSISTSLGYYTPHNKITSKPWYNVVEDVGVMGGVAHGIGHFLSAFGTGFSLFAINPVTLPASPFIGLATASSASGTRRYKELRDEGVAHETAKIGALITTGTTFAGGSVSGVIGKSLVSKAVTGGATNVAFGLGERQSIGAYLDYKGHKDLAQHYREVDGIHTTTEFIIGAGLGALHGKGGKHPDIKPSDVDIAQVVKRDIDDIYHSAPAIATTSRSAELHAQTLEQAIEKMRRGEEINVDPKSIDLMTKDMITKPEVEFSPELKKQLKQGEDFLAQQEVSKPKALKEQDPLSSQVPEYERRLTDLEQQFAHEPGIKEHITRDIELSKKDVFTVALNCLFGVKG